MAGGGADASSYCTQLARTYMHGCRAHMLPPVAITVALNCHPAPIRCPPMPTSSLSGVTRECPTQTTYVLPAAAALCSARRPILSSVALPPAGWSRTAAAGNPEPISLPALVRSTPRYPPPRHVPRTPHCTCKQGTALTGLLTGARAQPRAVLQTRGMAVAAVALAPYGNATLLDRFRSCVPKLTGQLPLAVCVRHPSRPVSGLACMYKVMTCICIHALPWSAPC